MIHSWIADSPWYVQFPVALKHPLPQLFHSTLYNLGWVGLDLAAILQILFIINAAKALTGRLCFADPRLKMLCWAVLASPAILWGRQIGSDALGYAFMLYAFSNIGRTPRFLFLTVMACLCRHQYVFLLCGLLLNKQTAKYFLAVFFASVFAVALGVKTPTGNLLPSYVLCIDWDKKPLGMSHFQYLNLYCGGDRASVQTLPGPCAPKISDYFTHFNRFMTVWGSSVYDNFRFHQIAALAFLLAFPYRRTQRIVFLCLCHYALIIFSNSLYFQQYTLMIELCLIACLIRIYEISKFAERRL